MKELKISNQSNKFGGMVGGHFRLVKTNNIKMQNVNDTYPMGIPYCGYANMGMPAS